MSVAVDEAVHDCIVSPGPAERSIVHGVPLPPGVIDIAAFFVQVAGEISDSVIVGNGRIVTV